MRGLITGGMAWKRASSSYSEQFHTQSCVREILENDFQFGWLGKRTLYGQKANRNKRRASHARNNAGLCCAKSENYILIQQAYLTLAINGNRISIDPCAPAEN